MPMYLSAMPSNMEWLLMILVAVCVVPIVIVAFVLRSRKSNRARHGKQNAD